MDSMSSAPYRRQYGTIKHLEKRTASGQFIVSRVQYIRRNYTERGNRSSTGRLRILQSSASFFQHLAPFLDRRLLETLGAMVAALRLSKKTSLEETARRKRKREVYEVYA